jgi:uncharacterized protein (UPF0548 family)
VGVGSDQWVLAQELGSTWLLKRRSGFRVADPEPSRPVQVGDDAVLRPKLWLLHISEPVRVVAAVNVPERCGFAYGTRWGHPIAGEEAFIFHRDKEEHVYFTHRAMTAAAPGWRRYLYPGALLLQRMVRRRYQREAVRYVSSSRNAGRRAR